MFPKMVGPKFCLTQSVVCLTKASDHLPVRFCFQTLIDFISPWP